MSVKHKHGARNLLAYWWDEFLFARYFDYETPLTPDEVGELLEDNISGKARQRSWFRYGLYNSVTLMQQGDKSSDFAVKTSQTSSFLGHIVTAQAEGRIYADQARGVTIVTGKVTFGRAHHVLLTGGALFSLLMILQGLSGHSFEAYFFWPVILALYWYEAWRDRNELAEKIDESIMQAKVKTAQTKLDDDFAQRTIGTKTKPKEREKMKRT